MMSSLAMLDHHDGGFACAEGRRMRMGLDLQAIAKADQWRNPWCASFIQAKYKILGVSFASSRSWDAGHFHVCGVRARCGGGVFVSW